MQHGAVPYAGKGNRKMNVNLFGKLFGNDFHATPTAPRAFEVVTSALGDLAHSVQQHATPRTASKCLVHLVVVVVHRGSEPLCGTTLDRQTCRMIVVLPC